jgi:acyl-coenzyme A synthetase/AMP-(fatty) acid ligase
MVPREAIVLEQLPTNANGKVARAALRAWHASGAPETAGA